MTDDALHKAARQIQRQAQNLGIVTVVVDQERRVHVIPGASADVIAVYQQGVTRAEVLEDLEFARAES